MKTIKTSGLLIFIFCFGAFNISFLLEKYRLTEDIIYENMDDSRASLFLENTDALTGNVTSSNFKFLSSLEKKFILLNNQLLEKYSISGEEIEKIATNIENQIKIEEVVSHFPDSEAGRFKAQAFKDYGSWLEGREPSNREELRNLIQNVADNIRDYAIIGTFGFDKYRIKDLKYRLTRASSEGPVSGNSIFWLLLCFGGTVLGGLLYILPNIILQKPGIRNEDIHKKPMSNRGWLGILTGTYLIAFYIILYFFHPYMTTWIIMVDPVSQALSGNPAGQFFLYGFIYTLVILVMGVRMFIRYRHSRYQLLRTVSVMFFQTSFAFLIPEILVRLNQPYYDFKNIWPLDYDFFFDNELNTLIESGGLGIFMLVWGIALVVIAVPVFVYFFGKRWYCSWVCGCGGLAETLGDPYRHLSDKTLKSWKIERYLIHGILGLAIIMTAGVLYTYFSGSGTVLGINTYSLRESYGLWIGAGFAGVVGTGFYPFMGNRVWCRFGCPLAAYLGVVQRFKSRFRITTNGGQCISCGNCSTYCEMGIDVRWYAQRGQNIIRSSCVGCGICSAVCPRGVLNLEVKSEKGRFGKAELLG